MTNLRRAQIEQLRAEGALAYKQGRHVQTNPHRYADAYQWWQGYVDAKRSAEVEDD